MPLALIVGVIVVVVSALLACLGYLIDRTEDRFESNRNRD